MSAQPAPFRAYLRPRLPLALPVAVLLVAAAIRLQVVHSGVGWRGLGGYDEGVYVAGALTFVQGWWPYADFTLVHPPGGLLVLAPIASLHGWLGDDGVLGAVRLLGVTLGAANAALISVLLRPVGWQAALAGGLAYACWGATANPESGFTLITVVNTCLILALLARNRPIIGGALLGLALTVKLWAVVPLIAMLGWWWGRHSGLTKRALASCVATVMAICLPFLVADPGAMWHQVVISQAGRNPEESMSWIGRLQALASGALIGPPAFGLATLAVLVAAVVALLLRPRPWGRGAWLLLAGILQVVMLLMSPSFYVHYPQVLGPVVATGAGLLTARLSAMSSVPRLVAPTLVVFAAALLAVLTVRPVATERAAVARITAFTTAHRCIWVLEPGLLLTADAWSRGLDQRCPFDVDPFGSILAAGPGSERRPERLGLDVSAWQEQAQVQASRADAAILTWLRHSLGPEARAYLDTHFRRVSKGGGAWWYVRHPAGIG